MSHGLEKESADEQVQTEQQVGTNVPAEHSQLPKMISTCFKKGTGCFYKKEIQILLPQIVISFNVLCDLLNMKGWLIYMNNVRLN